LGNDQYGATVDPRSRERELLAATGEVEMTEKPIRFSEQESAEVVIRSLGDATDPRLREVLSSLVSHIHSFVKDVQLTEAEWDAAIEFLTATGHKCDPTRQEFILLSDVLGVSMLVETINNRAVRDATEQTVLGPFHVVESPARALGDDIALDGKGERCVVVGTVRNVDGEPIPGATIDVWQANAEGFYDVQQPGVIPERNLRGLFTTDSDGAFWFRSIVPRYYPIPDDGPVGELLAATGRHPNRPAHVHFIVDAPGYESVTTHIFVRDSPYLDSDVVFGVKDSLIKDFRHIDDADQAAAYGVAAPFHEVRFDVLLRREEAGA
jgi:protocatechuate 3,4-dioxygenase beta subunit